MDIFKTAMNPGIAQNVTTQFFLSTSYQVTKIWLVVPVPIVTSFKVPSPNLELLLNMFDKATLESFNGPENITSF